MQLYRLPKAKFLALWSLVILPLKIQAISTKPPPASATSSKVPKKQQRVKPMPYIATASTVEHTRALTHYLKKGDQVLELGAQLDASSTAIRNAVGLNGRAVFVDVKRTKTNSGRSAQGTRDSETFLERDAKNFDYIELDQFAQWRTVLDDFDVLVLDVTAMCGNDLELTAISIMNEFVEYILRRGSRPRAVVVKSKAISSLARRLVHAQRLFDGTVTRDLKIPSRDGRPYIVAGVGVEEYRRTIPHVVNRGDNIVEVGCHSGTTTTLVHDAAKSVRKEGEEPQGYCIGVDIGPKIIEEAKREHPDVHFAVGDAWKTLDLLRIKKEAYPESCSDGLEGFNVVYADIGGLSGPDGTLESLSLLDGLGYALEPRCIVIKSLCMKRLASSLRSFSDLWENTRK